MLDRVYKSDLRFYFVYRFERETINVINFLRSSLVALQDLVYASRDHAQKVPSGVLTPVLAHHQHIP